MVRPEDSLHAIIRSIPPAHKDLVSSRNSQEFNDALATIIQQAVGVFETDRKELRKLSENALSNVLCGALNSTLALRVTREENSNGHVDLTFHADLCTPPRKSLGEAKIHNSASWHKKGIKQLLKYSTGREERGVLLVYVKTGQVKTCVEKLRQSIEDDRSCDLVDGCMDHDTKWSFVSAHRHPTGEVVEIWHLGCDLTDH